MTEVRYEPGGIIISLTSLTRCAPDVDVGAVQNRLSPDDFKQCWERMKALVAINFKIQNILLLMFVVIFFSLFIYSATGGRYINFGVILPLFFSCFGCIILVIINAAQMKKKLKQFFERENQGIWNPRGLYWQYTEHHVRTGHRRKKTTVSYLELRVLSSAMDYNAPGQFQYSFQGAIPNPYMQPGANYSPQMELRKYSHYVL